MPDDNLVRVLSEIQRRGAIGRTSIPEAIAHADRFVAALPHEVGSLIDLGSGGGLPGLVIAARRNDIAIVLTERRAKRVDLLRYGIRALNLTATTTVFEGNAEEYTATADVVTARSFGPPLLVLQTAAALLSPGGCVLVSEPPNRTVRCSDEELTTLGFVEDSCDDGIRRYLRRARQV